MSLFLRRALLACSLFAMTGAPALAHPKHRPLGPPPTVSFLGIFSDSSLVSNARKYIGGNPTGRSRRWCGAFMDKVLRETGHKGGGNLAAAYARYGTRVSGPQVGAIAVMNHHVGVVSGVDANGNPIIISGNYSHRVEETTYPKGRIAAYVLPD